MAAQTGGVDIWQLNYGTQKIDGGVVTDSEQRKAEAWPPVAEKQIGNQQEARQFPEL